MKYKTKVLLNWDTDRKDLFKPFIELKDDIEFIVLHKGQEDGSVRVHPFREIFFYNYSTPYKILKEIKPDAVLFFGIYSFPQIALNLAAKNLGIRSYTLHHGIHPTNRLAINIEKNAAGINNRNKRLISNFKTVRFYLSAIRFNNINQLFSYLSFPVKRRRSNTLVAMEKSQFSARMPTKFIDLSPHNAISTKEVNHLNNDEKFIYIGHPWFDEYIARFIELQNSSKASSEKYNLLIDYANIDSNFAYKKSGRKAKDMLYKKLSQISRQSNRRLKIKVHPAGYHYNFNLQDDNIDLVYDTDTPQLIYSAEDCYSFYSTLVIPVIFYKGFCNLLDAGFNVSTQDELLDLGVVNKIRISDLDTEATFKKNAVLNYDEFIKRYIYIEDANATNRLKEVLAKGFVEDYKK